MNPHDIRTRRQAVADTATALTAAVLMPSVLCGAAFAADASALGAIAAEKGILFGASFSAHELDRPYAARYAETYERDARILAGEHEFSLAALRPDRDALNFQAADRVIDFGGRRGMKVRARALISDDGLPAWISSMRLSEIEPLLEAHVVSVLQRYRDSVNYWDAVAAPIGPWDRQSGNLRNGSFLAALGETYIDKTFKIARTSAPGSKLVLSEGETHRPGTTGQTFRDSLLALLKRLKERSVPIDAIALETHLTLVESYDFAQYDAFLSSVAALGYDIHITQLDVNDTGVPGPISARDLAVAELYERYLGSVLKNPAVKVVELSQLADPASWMRDPVTSAQLGIRPKARPVVYDEAFRKKPSWDAIARALKAAPAR